MQLVDTTDAMGGTGSIPDNLRTIATSGLSRFVDGFLSRQFPLTSFNEPQAVDAYGNLLPKGAPQTPVVAAKTFADIVSQPIVIAGILVTVAVVALAVIRR